jgi:predicted secreted hydrolase
MDTPEDYARLKVSPDGVEPWEDQRRDDARRGVWEWWYFDALLDDGTAVVIQFFTKSGASSFRGGDHPRVWIKVTDRDGITHDEKVTVPAGESRFGTGSCDVQIGPHQFKGDLHDYAIRVDPIGGVGADLHLSSRGKPFRPGTAYFGFGEHDEKYFTWLCAVPKGEVTGTVTVDGATRQVHGTGYHDHQWGNSNFQLLWNNWLWARQGFEDYSILVFDFVAAAKYGFQRIPVCFVQDADGDLVFTNTHDVGYEVLEEMRDPTSGKDCPKVSRYRFDHDGVQVEYTLTANTILESRDIVSVAPQMIRKRLGTTLGDPIGGAVGKALGFALRRKGIQPSYTRFAATGELRLTRNGQTVDRSGELIYEFMYPGLSYREHA